MVIDPTSSKKDPLSAVQLRVLPLLILANKQDLPNALSAEAIADKLGVARPVSCQNVGDMCMCMCMCM